MDAAAPRSIKSVFSGAYSLDDCRSHAGRSRAPSFPLVELVRPTDSDRARTGQTRVGGYCPVTGTARALSRAACRHGPNGPSHASAVGRGRLNPGLWKQTMARVLSPLCVGNARLEAGEVFTSESIRPPKRNSPPVCPRRKWRPGVLSLQIRMRAVRAPPSLATGSRPYPSGNHPNCAPLAAICDEGQ